MHSTMPENVDKWMVIMFPMEEITEYHTDARKLLPADVARLELGDTTKMMWDEEEYDVTCVFIDTQKKCERIVKKLVKGTMHLSDLDIPPPLLGDHCRMCKKLFNGKLAVLIHQLEHTVNTCPILHCCHTFKDVSRLEAHLRRHVEGNVRVKLETDDEGCNEHLNDERWLNNRKKKVRKERNENEEKDEEGDDEGSEHERPKKERRISGVEKRRRTMEAKPKFNCPVCSRSFSYEKSYTKHIKEHEENKEEESEENDSEAENEEETNKENGESETERLKANNNKFSADPG